MLPSLSSLITLSSPAPESSACRPRIPERTHTSTVDCRATGKCCARKFLSYSYYQRGTAIGARSLRSERASESRVRLLTAMAASLQSACIYDLLEDDDNFIRRGNRIRRSRIVLSESPSAVQSSLSQPLSQSFSHVGPAARHAISSFRERLRNALPSHDPL